ncbi:hypothetical protein EYF80_012340 [Liparis tanakae]|uniref:Uncharacterized protein n=1 Tax=Liparis tanakae TaxID=230148 RepID=A0A4Z2IHF3_9TELE|nr:hypothetical protein EYF80_012340 [Liparis tanakae]
MSVLKITATSSLLPQSAIVVWLPRRCCCQLSWRRRRVSSAVRMRVSVIECGQDSPVRPVPRRGGVGGRVGTEGERQRREERGERRAGLAGCGLEWQQIVLDHSNPFNSTGNLQLVARRPRLERRRFRSREGTNQTAGERG